MAKMKKIRALTDIISIGAEHRLEMKPGQTRSLHHELADGLVRQGLAQHADPSEIRKAKQTALEEEVEAEEEEEEEETEEEEAETEEAVEAPKTRTPRKKKTRKASAPVGDGTLRRLSTD